MAVYHVYLLVLYGTGPATFDQTTITAIRALASTSKKQVGLAMSGGVDSTASALLLKGHHTVHGYLMDIGQPGFDQQAAQVNAIAGRLGIDLTIVDLKNEFNRLVLGYFSDSYQKGKTPNPCMVCNQKIKCGLFLEYILSTGMDFMATGHYVRRQEVGTETALFRGLDPSKDQSYFLARLSTDQLARMLFPLGSMLKEQTYEFMEAHGFDDFRGKESQDICFLKGTTVADFLSTRPSSEIAPGPIVTIDGDCLGTHQGLHRYTIGQRRGLGLPDHSPWYVCGLDASTNRVVIGKHDDLFTTRLQAIDQNWLVSSPPLIGDRFRVKIRYTHKGTEATLTALEENGLELQFDQPQRAVAPGQFVVLYDEDRVIGSAEIVAQPQASS